MRPLIRSLPWILGLGLCAFALIYALWPSPVRVEIVRASRGPMMVTVNEDGKTRVRERYIVSAPVSGLLARLEIHAGDIVEANKTVIATIEPTNPALLDARSLAEAESRVKAAEANKQRAQARLEAASEAYGLTEHELARAKRLSPNAISQAEIDSAEHQELISAATLRAAEFGDRVATFELEMAQAAFVRTRPKSESQSEFNRLDIRSPVSGQVFRVIEENAIVVSAGQPLAEIGNTQELELVIDVLSVDAPRIKVGARVLIEHAGFGTLEARVRLIEPSGFTKVSALGVEEQRVNVIADFAESTDRLRGLGDNYRVDANIVVWETPLATKVPSGALFRQGQDWAVFIVKNGRARIQAIGVGQSSNFEVEVLSGLSPEDDVVNYPGDKVWNGVVVLRE
ncbi:MAG: efflux RND transporter periplasmic adaptor subunit [Pirellula sp.]|jgi:HlyD family secretion protein